MRREPAAFLWDIREAAGRIHAYVAGLSFDEFAANDLVRSAVERQFEIIGEALSQLTRVAPQLTGGADSRGAPDHRVSQHPDPRLRGARSSDRLGVVQDHLPPLAAVIDRLLQFAPPPSSVR